MAKILVGGAGGAPSEGVIRSFLAGRKSEKVIGMGSEITDLVLSASERRYVVPYADKPEYWGALKKILIKERPAFIHFQNDLEIYHASLLRDGIHDLGVKTFLPEHDVIDTCVHKYKSYLRFKAAGVPVPENQLIEDESSLKKAFAELGNGRGEIWLRAASIGGGGKGSLPTNDYALAKAWIDRYGGWGEFVAAQMLTSKTVTWLSVWHEGRLIVAQTRVRMGWTHGNRSASGVTGVTKVGMTCSDCVVDEIAQRAVRAVSEKPHGIFGVDMAYDSNGVPNPTEINIARFFTTILFFTKAGLNLPEIYKDIALYQEFPVLPKNINPLADGWVWLRGMDTEPLLVRADDLEKDVVRL